MLRKKHKSDENLNVQTEFKIKLILGWARQGKTFKMEEIFAADTRRKVLYTFAHKNRIKICDEVYKRHKQSIIEYTDVLAAIELKGALWENAEVVYIDFSVGKRCYQLILRNDTTLSTSYLTRKSQRARKVCIPMIDLRFVFVYLAGRMIIG